MSENRLNAPLPASAWARYAAEHPDDEFAAAQARRKPCDCGLDWHAAAYTWVLRLNAHFERLPKNGWGVCGCEQVQHYSHGLGHFLVEADQEGVAEAVADMSEATASFMQVGGSCGARCEATHPVEWSPRR